VVLGHDRHESRTPPPRPRPQSFRRVHHVRERLSAALDPVRSLTLSETRERAPTATPEPGSSRHTVARNTAIFSVATGFSRVAGLAREIAAASFFGTTGPASAFTIAFQIPQLLNWLFAQTALSAAFIPVFTELIHQGRRAEAFRLASTLLWTMVLVVGGITVALILAAGLIMPLFIGSSFNADLTSLTVGLSQVMFPVVLLLSLTGLVVGVLQSNERFTIPAFAPVVWNLVILLFMVVLRHRFHDGNELYAYAIGVLVATAVQLAMSLAALRRVDFRLQLTLDWRDPRVRRVLTLMLPVSLTIGVLNVDLFINSALGTLVGQQAPRAIDAAFKLYSLPQGMFSVAVATVLFPPLSLFASRGDNAAIRRTLGSGMRQILLLLIPAAALMLVLATPIVRLVYQRGQFTAHSTHLTSIALFWFACNLPFAGVNLLLTRMFFAAQRPWIPTALAAINIIVDTAVSLALYKPLGITGLVLGTAAAQVVMLLLQIRQLRTLYGRLDGIRTTRTTARIVVASALLAGAAWGVWRLLNALLGASLVAQVLSVGLGIAVGMLIYTLAVLVLRVPEAHQIRRFITRRRPEALAGEV
jgi:putative peptidoglycan lipid II flippase